MSVDSLFTLDLFLYNILKSIKCIPEKMHHMDYNRINKRIAELKDRKHGDIVYICANGPSLNKVKFEKLDEDYIVMNDFFRKTIDPSNPPTYYIAMDGAYAEDRFAERFDGLFNLNYKTTYILNCSFYGKLKEKYPELIDRSYFFYSGGHLYSHKDKIDYTKPVGQSWNVATEAIIFAMYLGYKEIRLLGLDYSVFANNPHFYAVPQSHDSLKSMLFKYCFSTHVHYEVARYAKEHDIRIINMTKDTLLDAYEIDLNSPY